MTRSLSCLLAVSLFLPSNGPPTPTAQHNRDHAASASATRGAAEKRISRGRTEFHAIAGIQELSGRMILRPVTSSGVKPSLGAATADSLLAHYERIDFVPQTGEWILRVPRGQTEEQVAAELLATGLFEYVEPDWMVYPTTMPQSVSLPPQIAATPQLVRNCPERPPVRDAMAPRGRPTRLLLRVGR